GRGPDPRRDPRGVPRAGPRHALARAARRRRPAAGQAGQRRLPRGRAGGSPEQLGRGEPDPREQGAPDRGPAPVGRRQRGEAGLRPLPPAARRSGADHRGRGNEDRQPARVPEAAHRRSGARRVTGPDPRIDAERRAQGGDLLGAAEAYGRAGLYLEAAQPYRALDDGAAALASVTRVLPDHPRYREACVVAITLAVEQDRLSLALENFLARFLRTAPETERETPALDALARLYERHLFPENAAE